MNLGAVLGQIATGGGAARLQQVMASVGVPSMSKPSTERYIAEHLQAQLAESMIAAGKEERRLAIENDEHFQGVPAITVIADRGWSKRSHKHSYNAKSGVAVIIGSRTKKLLFLGIRNKYCSTCSIAENAGKEAPEHMCYRNWAGSSPAMESDTLVAGFRQAEKTHGVRYMHLIGDGDSSVLTSIYERVPVWGRYVRKIECVNHALKNYRAKLETIVKEKPSYKGAGKLSQKTIRRLTAGARAAIQMHASTRDVKQLRHGLRNAPYHVFGEHSKCNPAFCQVRADTAEETSEEDTTSDTDPNPPVEPPTTLQQQINALIQQEEEDNLSPATLPLHEEAEARSGYTASLDQLPEGLLFSVLCASDRTVSLAEQLVDNQTSNLAECYMGLRSYFDCGKVYIRVQSGSFEGRCYADGLRYQAGLQWITHAFEEVTGQPPPQPLADVTNKLEKRTRKERKHKQSTEYKQRRKKAKHQRNSDSFSNDYGPDAAQPDLPQELQRLCLEYKRSLYVSSSERGRIEEATRDQAAEALWFEQRKCRLTASNFGVVARRRLTTPVAKLVRNLLYDTLRESRALQWGKVHEEHARQAYLRAKGSSVVLTRSGLVIDSERGWLACSPDDLARDYSVAEDEYSLVEYKCPYSVRDITVEEACKKKDFTAYVKDGQVTLKHTHRYYYQVQGQMAICQRRWCDFVIWTPCSLTIERIPFDLNFWQEVMPKLEHFYNTAVLPKLASPRHPQGQPIREPGNSSDT